MARNPRNPLLFGASIAMLACALPLGAAAHAAPAKATSSAVAAEVVPLWSRTPTDTYLSGPEVRGSSKAPTGSAIATIANVTQPTLTVVRPAPGKANGTAMVIAPGGAFMALAWDLEGEEVARWLAARGVTAFILKYRVGPPPRKAGEPWPSDVAAFLRMLEPNRKLAVADGSQAIRYVRENAARYSIRPDRIGMMGFSAGAMTTMGVVLEGGPAARPDFVVPIYGMLASSAPVPVDAPPAFVVIAADDTTVPPAGSIEIFTRWLAAKRPAELHVYQKGQHGFGMRPQGNTIDHWPAALEAWMKLQGVLPAMPGKATRP